MKTTKLIALVGTSVLALFSTVTYISCNKSEPAGDRFVKMLIVKTEAFARMEHVNASKVPTAHIARSYGVKRYMTVGRFFTTIWTDQKK